MPGKHSEEKQHNIDAFEHWYSLGGRGTAVNFQTVAKQAGVSVRTIENWMKKYNWRERVRQRNIAIAKRTDEKVIEEVSDIKADILKELTETAMILRGTIRKSVSTDKQGRPVDFKLEPQSAGELSKLTNSQVTVSKTRLLLVGEATERLQHLVTLQDIIMGAADGSGSEGTG